MKILSTIVLSAALVFAAPAFAFEAIKNHEHIALARVDGSALTAEQVKKAIVVGATLKGWSVKEAGPGKLVLTIVVRNKHTAVVDVGYNDKGYSIKYASSINLNVDKDEEGRDIIHPNYNRWIGNLMLSIKTAAMMQP